jgi:hypothetical protein
MIPRFKIEREGNKRYVIKRKAWLLPPLYEMRLMTKNEFIGDLNSYGDYVLSKEEAVFKSLDDAYDALHQYAQINGIVEVVVKVSD